jgi:hypothetical protein
MLQGVSGVSTTPTPPPALLQNLSHLPPPPFRSFLYCSRLELCHVRKRARGLPPPSSQRIRSHAQGVVRPDTWCMKCTAVVPLFRRAFPKLRRLYVFPDVTPVRLPGRLG